MRAQWELRVSRLLHTPRSHRNVRFTQTNRRKYVLYTSFLARLRSVTFGSINDTACRAIGCGKQCQPEAPGALDRLECAMRAQLQWYSTTSLVESSRAHLYEGCTALSPLKSGAEVLIAPIAPTLAILNPTPRCCASDNWAR